MQTGIRFFIFLSVATITAISGSVQADSGKFMGTASCSSSNCHGSTTASKEGILRNEYVTWHRHDRHSKAYEVLLGDDAKKIATNLGIDAAETDPQCLTCHATYLTDSAQKGDAYDIEDGVSCESCHGAAEHWLASHTASGRSHADNINDGMRDLVPLEARAKLCVSCHYGDAERQVSHRLIGAGHPRLSFELDTFSILQPAHWEVDKDYLERKTAYNPARAWLTGQVVLAESFLAALASPTRSKDGMFPELSLFNCYACHHDLTDEQWKVRDYDGKPGRLRLNTSALLVVRESLTVLAPVIAVELSRALSTFHDSFYEGTGDVALGELQRLLTKKIKPLVEHVPLSDSDLSAVLVSIVRFAAERPHLQYEEAEQLAMAMSALLSAHTDKGTKYQKDIDAIYAALRNAKRFEADAFTTASKRFLTVLE